MRSTYRRFPPKKFYFTNYRIQAESLRVIDNQGKQIGILTKDEALRIAREKELDLVLITSHTQPPIAKIIDFKKFLYSEEKKQKEAKKGIKKSVVKDIALSLFIAQADLERLINRGKEFLKQGNQLRINLALKGREIGKKNMAFALINRFLASLEEINIAKEPRLEGRVIRTVVFRKK